MVNEFTNQNLRIPTLTCPFYHTRKGGHTKHTKAHVLHSTVLDFQKKNLGQVTPSFHFWLPEQVFWSQKLYFRINGMQ